MNLISVKRTNDMKLDGITIDSEWRDKQLSALTLTDAKGNMLRIATENYVVRAYVQAPPETKKVHVVTGAVPTLGTPIREEFEDAYEATNRKHDLERAGVIENAALEVEDVEVVF